MSLHWWRNRPVFITGATGFVGGHLVRALADRGAEVICLVRDRTGAVLPGVQIHGDVRDQTLLARIMNEYSIEVVYHLAAQAIVPRANQYPPETLDTNINGTRAVLEAARQVGGQSIQVIAASSDKAYGECDLDPEGRRKAYTEETPLLGLDPYAVSKACADRIAQSYLVHYGMKVSIARCGNIYGGGDLNWHRLIPGTIRRLIQGQAPVIFGTGQETRDFFYVEDVVAAYLLLAESDARGPFNFSVGIEYTVAQVIDMLCQLMCAPYHPVPLGRTAGEISYQVLDSSRARDGLGWLPAYSLSEGLEKTVAWYRAYLAEVER